MNNNEKYKKVFLESLSIDQSSFNEELKYNEIPEWDSIGHMTLISNLESEFNISIDIDDVLNYGSFKKGVELLKKYKVQF